MTTYYVNSFTGSDSNTGLSSNLAKRTLVGVVTPATTGDTIYCTGRFIETHPNINKILKFIGFPQATFDGLGLTYFMHNHYAGYHFFSNIVFERFGTAPLSAGGFGFFTNCIFKNQPCAVQVANTYGNDKYFYNCLFYGHSVAAIDQGSWYMYSDSFYNCVFYNNPTSFKCIVGASPYGITKIFNCVFGDAIIYQSNGVNGYPTANFNIYDLTNGYMTKGGVTYNNLASWQGATGQDSFSVSQVFNTADKSNNVFRWAPNNIQKILGRTVGLPDPAIAISNSVNQSLWTGGVFSNTEIDGNGNLILSAGQAVGTWKSDILDLGAQIPIYKIELSIQGEDATNFVDYDTADTPGYYTIRLRASNTPFAKDAASPDWVVVKRDEEVGQFMVSNYRYWQIELTLRGN